MNSLRIAQVSPLYESVPPRLYGGTERVVFNLCEGLVQMGHQVTLFASGDSLTSANLVPIGRCALRLAEVRETLAPHVYMFEKVRQMADQFDIIHFHNEYMHFNIARELAVPHVSTLHGRLDFSEYRDLFAAFANLPLVSISDNQRSALPKQNWLATVHHGISAGPPGPGGEHLVFLGRISPEKGVEEAIEIAHRSGRQLKIAAKIENADYEYYLKLRHRFTGPDVEYVGEIGEREKPGFLGGAKALLFPISWPEPFGLVMIEALAMGTPVVAFARGSVPEVIRDGTTGFIVQDVEGACRALGEIGRIARLDCRREYESRFTVARMTADYLDVYERVMRMKSVRNRKAKTSSVMNIALSRGNH